MDSAQKCNPERNKPANKNNHYFSGKLFEWVVSQVKGIFESQSVYSCKAKKETKNHEIFFITNPNRSIRLMGTLR
jgi:hypothetical protein